MGPHSKTDLISEASERMLCEIKDVTGFAVHVWIRLPFDVL